MARALSRARLRLAKEEGIGIVEVMVSAMLLIIIGIAVLNGIDTATGVSGTARARAIAANVAQEDQERLRTMKAQQLSNFFDVTTQTVSGISFTTTSRADWVADSDSNGNSCERGSANNDYLKLTSTTEWAEADRPVKLESIMAPPNGSFGPSQGSVGVQVDGRDDVGKPGVDVDIVGPPSQDKDTDAQGCAFFGFLPAGNQYHAVLDVAGFVDPDGKQRVDKAVSVQPEGLTAQNFKYDLAAEVKANFTTKVNGVVRAAKHDSLMVSNPGMTAGHKVVPSGNGLQGAITASSLFPFPAPYAVYAGDCPAALPKDSSNTTLPEHLVQLDPGEGTSLDVRMPALNLRVLNGSTAVTGALVRLKPTGTGCSTISKTTNAAGEFDNPELPFGDYGICVNVSGGRKTATTTAVNRNPEGTAYVLNLQPLTLQSGACP